MQSRCCVGSIGVCAKRILQFSKNHRLLNGGPEADIGACAATCRFADRLKPPAIAHSHDKLSATSLT